MNRKGPSKDGSPGGSAEGREGRKSPDSCGSVAGTGLSGSPLTSGSVRCKNGEEEEVVVEEAEEGSGRDKVGETGRTGTDTESPSGATEGGETTGTEAERGMTAGTETGADIGTGGEARDHRTGDESKELSSPVCDRCLDAQSSCLRPVEELGSEGDCDCKGNDEHFNEQIAFL